MWSGDFSLHRNQSLDLARSIAASCDSYILLIDADEVLVVKSIEAFLLCLRQDRVVTWWAEDADWRFRKLGLIRIADAIEWRGTVHEHLVVSAECEAASQVSQDAAHLIYGHNGFRRRNATITTAADLRWLARAVLGRNPADDYRASFYLARTHEVSLDFGIAAVHFRAAATQAQFDDDKWQALWGLGRVLLQQESLAEAAAAFTAATAVAPARAETLIGLSNIALRLKQFPEALTLAYEALSKPQPNETSMYDKSAYGWRAVDTLSMSAFALGNCEALRDAVLRYGDLLRQGRVPQREIARIEQNIVCIKSALG
ncbi:MAG: tetratricopeptide repeat protein [Burkholderiales bacterium]